MSRILVHHGINQTQHFSFPFPSIAHVVRLHAVVSLENLVVILSTCTISSQELPLDSREVVFLGIKSPSARNVSIQLRSLTVQIEDHTTIATYRFVHMDVASASAVEMSLVDSQIRLVLLNTEDGFRPLFINGRYLMLQSL